MTDKHPCAAPDCSAPAEPGQLMCKPCWFALPPKLRRKVNATWRNYRREPAPYREARDEAIEFHAARIRRDTRQGKLPL